jgi:aminomethyltransferase
VDLTKDFIGSDVLKRVKAEGPRRKITGFEVEGKRIARQGAPILRDGQQVGTVTSGTQSPTLGKNIAMGLLDSELATPGQSVEIDVRGTKCTTTVVPLPFYKAKK